jgi:hypothetical protein
MAKTASAPDMAAAVAAAIAQFVADSGPAPGGASEAVGPWQRAALVEGVSAKDTATSNEGAKWLS